MNESNSGIGIGGLLLVLFVGLKLTHYIDWPWVWVLAPIWIPTSIAVIVGAVLYVMARGR